MRKFYGLLFCILFSPIFIMGQAESTKSKTRSNRFLKRVAYNEVDHFFVGGHIGVNIMFAHEDQVINHQIVRSIIQFDPNPVLQPSLPCFRVFGGYKYKRHSFELGLEALQQAYYTGSPKISYSTCWFTSLSYNIDLLYKKPHFKIYTGAQLGFIVVPQIVPPITIVIPAAGINFKLEAPITRVFSLYWDTRLIIGLAPVVENWNYTEANDGYYRRIFMLNPTLGCKFNIFTKTQSSHKME